jgi:hypothetical protein
MGERLTAIDESRSVSLARPFRKTFVLVEGFTAVGGVMGSVMLISGTGTPPVSVLQPVGLTSWVLPGLWLFATAAAPSAVAAVLAWRRSEWTPPVVLLASATLAIELLVQIPFLGPSWLQALFGAVAVSMTILALWAKRAGWWPAKLSRGVRRIR